MILRDTKATHLKVMFRPTLFVPHINDVGKREREYIILIRFWKKYIFYFFLLPFCYISCLLTCAMVQSTTAEECPLQVLVAIFIGNMQIQL